MSLFLDIVVVAIILISIFISARKGFVRTLISAVGFVLAVILAFTFSTPISNAIVDKFVKPAIEEKTIAVLEDSSIAGIGEAADKIWNELPSFVANAAESSGVGKDAIIENFSNTSLGTVEDVAEGLTDNVFVPVVGNLVKAITTLVIFVVLIILVSFLAKIVNKMFSGMIFGKFNRLLGGALGAAKGIGIALIFCLIISTFAGLSDNGFLSITQKTIDSTYIFSAILKIAKF